jgi:glutaminyl-peptide cyclotransferase
MRLIKVFLFALLCAALLMGCGGINKQAASGVTNAAVIPNETPLPLSPTPEDTSTSELEPTPIPTHTSVSTVLPSDPPQITLYTYRVVKTYPHRTDAFTQGLLYLDGDLYESTGLRGESTLRRVDLESGEPLQMRAVPLPTDVICGGATTLTACLNPAATSQFFFAEGLAAVDDRLYQLTWQERIGFIYDRTSFELLDTFAIPAEGWGLTYDGEQLLLSDGTDKLTYLDPATLQPIGQVTVQDSGVPINLLNELEFINGEVWANVWKTERLVRIDPDSGAVTGWAVLDGLLTQAASAAVDPGGRMDVLNGIAYDPETQRLFVTGKWWPLLFEIELVLAE